MIPQHGTLEISRSRLRHNISLLRQHAGQARLCATIKANAYGHGIDILASLIQAESIEWAAVYSHAEAIFLASQKNNALNILVLAPLMISELSPDLPPELLESNGGKVRFTLTDIASARHLSQAAMRAATPRPVPVHMQIDAGLTRAGIEPREAPALADIVGSLPHLTLEGAFAHFSHGDEPGHPTLQRQAATFLRAADEIKVKFPHLIVHIQNSGGAVHLQHQNAFDLARIGIALYGLQPSARHPIPGLQPVARVTAPILATHDRAKGVGVGYGHTFITRRPSRLAIVPVGYADGYPRGLSNNCVAQVRDIDVPVVGRVSMDQIILDITDLPSSIGPGETVTVISDNPAKPNSLDRMADMLGTIGYELATHLGQRLQRCVMD